MPHSTATRATLLFFVLVAIQSVQAQPQQPECCFDATCATCELISDCIAGSGPLSPADVAEIGGTAVCGVGSNVLCSTWWENNTEGVTNGSPASPTNPGGCLATCSDPNACNFNEFEDCEYLTCSGCTDPSACNYNDQSTLDNGTCEFITDFQGSFAGMDFVAQRENQLYFLTEVKMTWPEAESLALGIGGHLVCINSSEEQDFLNLNFDTSGGANELWIGLYQDTNSPLYAENNGGWTWSNGAPLDYTNWDAPEPSGGAAENYARYLNNDLWGDYINDGIHRAIIEVDGCQLETTGPVDTTSSVVLYFEDFESFPDYYGLRNGGNSGGFDGTETEWTLEGDPSTLTEDLDYFSVENIAGDKNFSGRDLDGEFIWTSKAINITGYNGLSFAAQLEEEGTLEPEDYIKLFYVKDDDSEVLIAQRFDDFGSATFSEDAFESSTSLRFRFKVNLNGGLENYRFDDLLLQSSPCTAGNSDGDGICDESDNCIDLSALNYADPNNPACLYQIFYEPFTDDSQFTKNVDFSHDGVSDYWGIYDPNGNTDDFDGNAGRPSGVGTFNGIDGNFLVGEDMNATPILAEPGILTWSNIDISSFNADLTFELDIAERGAASDEYVELYAKLSSDPDYTLLIDPGGTLGSVGNTLTKQTSLGTFDGTSLDIQLRMYSDDGGDEVAVDDLRVLGTLNCNAVTVVADAQTVALNAAGIALVSAAPNDAVITVTASGDCFTATSFEISKTSISEGFGSSVNFDCSETGVQLIWIRATDGFNIGPVTATTILVQDDQAPTVNGVSDGTLNAGENATVELLASEAVVTASDNCPEGLNYLVSQQIDGEYLPSLELGCAEIGTIEVYFKAQDESGNLSAPEGPATFTIQDITAPTLATPSGTFNLGEGPDSEPDNRVIYFETAIGQNSGLGDNCTANEDLLLQVSKTGINWTSATNSVTYSCSEVGDQTLYLRATDESGNATTVSGQITIADDTPPVITSALPPSIELIAGAGQLTVSLDFVTASDNCTNAQDLELTMSRDGIAYSNALFFDCSDIGTHVLYFRSTDAFGNQSAAFEAPIVIYDESDLVAVAQNISVALSAFGTYSMSASEVNNGSIGNCNSMLTVSPSVFDCGDLGPNAVTLTISDGVNSSSTTSIVTVLDVTAPNVVATPSVIVNLDASGQGLILPSDASALGNPADYCTADSNLIYQIKRENGTFSPFVSVDCGDLGVGTFNVAVSAIDESGNSYETNNIPVTVLDITPPTVLSVTEGTTQSLNASGGVVLNAAEYLTATDNCSGAEELTYQLSGSYATGFGATFTADCNDVGSKIFYFRVVDASGNASAVVTEVIELADNTSPIAVANDIVLETSGTGSVVLGANDPVFNASVDNCTLATSGIKLSNGINFEQTLTFQELGVFTVSLKVLDVHGLSSFDEAIVTVVNQSIAGCTDIVACNYNPMANEDDSSCHYPSEMCQDPSEGLGYVFEINATLDGCDCTAQEFERVYFEDFGPGGASGGQGGGYGYDGYSDIDGDGIIDENNAALESEWTLGFSDPNAGDGILDGTEADYWTTIIAMAADQTATDTIFDGLYLGTEYQWSTRSISSEGAQYLRAQVEIATDGILEPSDYLKVRLIQDGVPSDTVLSEIIDDAPNPWPSFEIVDVVRPISASSLQIRMEAFNDAVGEFHTFDDVAVSLWGKLGCTDNLAVNFDALADITDGSCTYNFAPAYSLYSGSFAMPLWAPEPCEDNCSGPFIQARALPVLEQNQSVELDFVITPGTALNVDGIWPSSDGTWEELYVRNLIIEPNGHLIIPSGKRLIVQGNFFAVSTDQILGEGQICFQGQQAVFTNSPGEISLDTPICLSANELPCAEEEDAIGVCGGACLADIDGDGVCDDSDGCTDLEAANFADPNALSCIEGIPGCTYLEACNYQQDATKDDGTCTFPMTGLDCNGDCLLDTDEDGTCDEAEIPGCTDPSASNHHPAATEDNGSCTYGNGSCPADVDGDSVVGVADILEVLSSFGTACAD